VGLASGLASVLLSAAIDDPAVSDGESQFCEEAVVALLLEVFGRFDPGAADCCPKRLHCDRRVFMSMVYQVLYQPTSDLVVFLTLSMCCNPQYMHTTRDL